MVVVAPYLTTYEQLHEPTPSRKRQALPAPVGLPPPKSAEPEREDYEPECFLLTELSEMDEPLAAILIEEWFRPQADPVVLRKVEARRWKEIEEQKRRDERRMKDEERQRKLDHLRRTNVQGKWRARPPKVQSVSC